jgi:hypothetical protein
MVEGKVQLREFWWRPGHPDGGIEEDDIMSVQRYCRPLSEPHRQPQDDDEADRDRSHLRRRKFLGGVSRWLDNRRGRAAGSDRDHRGGWHRGESSHHHNAINRSFSPPPVRGGDTSEEKHNLRQLWSEKGTAHIDPKGFGCKEL